MTEPLDPIQRALRAVLIDAVAFSDTGDGTPYVKQYVITEWAYKLVQEALAYAERVDANSKGVEK